MAFFWTLSLPFPTSLQCRTASYPCNLTGFTSLLLSGFTETGIVVNLEFMKESPNPLPRYKNIMAQIIYTIKAWRSSFYLQGSKKCSESLSLSSKTQTLGGHTLTTCQSFLVQPALGKLLKCKYLYSISL